MKSEYLRAVITCAIFGKMDLFYGVCLLLLNVIRLEGKLTKMPKAGFIPQKLIPWIEARKRFHLSHAQVQMARELGMNPKKLGGMANHKQEPWKMPLPQYIEYLYEKQFATLSPDDTRSIEARGADKRAQKEAERAEEGNCGSGA